MPLYLLSGNAQKQLGSKSRLTTETVNPNNLAGLKFDKGIKLPKDWRNFTEESANQKIDEFREEAERLYQGARVAKEAKVTIDLQTKYNKAMEELRDAVYKGEVTLEAAYGKWLTLKQKLEDTRLRTAIGHAEAIATSNIARAKFGQSVNERMSRATNTAAGGTHRGALDLQKPDLQLAS